MSNKMKRILQDFFASTRFRLLDLVNFIIFLLPFLRTVVSILREEL